VYDAALEAEKRSRDIRRDPRDALAELPAIKGFLFGCGDSGSSAAAANNNNNAAEDVSSTAMDGFKRMERCRQALDALDTQGWKRSFFQKKFHNAFMAACARAFFKIDPPGSFQRAFQRILEINSWNNLSQVFPLSSLV
jgi:hypothetical protein